MKSTIDIHILYYYTVYNLIRNMYTNQNEYG